MVVDAEVVGSRWRGKPVTGGEGDRARREGSGWLALFSVRLGRLHLFCKVINCMSTKNGAVA